MLSVSWWHKNRKFTVDLRVSHLTWPRQKHLLHKLTWSELSKLHRKAKFEIDMAYISFRHSEIIFAMSLRSPTSSESSCFEVYKVSSILLENAVACFSPSIFTGDYSTVFSYISLYTIFGFVVVVVVFFFSSKTKEAAVIEVTLFSEKLQPSFNKASLWF